MVIESLVYATKMLEYSKDTDKYSLRRRQIESLASTRTALSLFADVVVLLWWPECFVFDNGMRRGPYERQIVSPAHLLSHWPATAEIHCHNFGYEIQHLSMFGCWCPFLFSLLINRWESSEMIQSIRNFFFVNRIICSAVHFTRATWMCCVLTANEYLTEIFRSLVSLQATSPIRLKYCCFGCGRFTDITLLNWWLHKIG